MKKIIHRESRYGRVFWYMFFISFLFIGIPLKGQDARHFFVFDGKNMKLNTTEKCIDLGVLQWKKSMNYTLEVRNQSESPLKISNVRGSCGLSVPSWPRKTIAAGGGEKIQVRYDATRLGAFTRNLTIHSTAEKGRTVICISGEVVLPSEP